MTRTTIPIDYDDLIVISYALPLDVVYDRAAGRLQGSEADIAAVAALLADIETHRAAANAPAYPPLKRWQFAAMCQFLGVADQIEAAIAALDDPLTKAIALARYRESDVYQRDDPLIEQLAPAVGLTAEQVDAAWMQIATGAAA